MYEVRGSRMLITIILLAAGVAFSIAAAASYKHRNAKSGNCTTAE
jgi:hypothetical protein